MAQKGNVVISKPACIALIVVINNAAATIQDNVAKIVRACNTVCDDKGLRGKSGAEIIKNYEEIAKKYEALQRSTEALSAKSNAKLAAYIHIAEDQAAKAKAAQANVAEKNVGVYKE